MSVAHRFCKKVGVAPLPFREAVGGGWQKNEINFLLIWVKKRLTD